MSAKTIVIAKSSGEVEDLAAAIATQGYKPLVEPVLHIEYLDPDLPEMDDAIPLAFTSANGVDAFAALSKLRDNPVYTVGRNTADAARRAGFKRIETAAGTVDDLVDILLKACGPERQEVLYVRGDHISKDLKSILASHNLTCRELTVYRSVPAQSFSMDLLKALDARDVAAILFFSVRGGQVFAELLEQYGRTDRMRTTKALCIGEGVLQSVSVLPFGGTLVADTPDRYGMIKLLEHLKE